jgi:hypothetical protein
MCGGAITGGGAIVGGGAIMGGCEMRDGEDPDRLPLPSFAIQRPFFATATAPRPPARACSFKTCPDSEK